MKYVSNYSEWRALYEEAEQASLFKINIADMWSKISDKLKKKYGKEPEEILNDAKAGLATAKASAIDLPEEPIQPEVPADIAAIEPEDKVVERLNESVDWEYWIDVAIDVLGGILDGIPGLQIASMITDMLHTISYALRWLLSANENSKIKYLIMSILGIVSASVPLGGNLMNLSALKTVDKWLQASPQALAKLGYGIVGKKLPFPHWSMFAKWKVKFVYVFLKVVGQGAQEMLEKLSSFFAKMFNGLSAYLNSWIKASPMTGWIISDYVMPAINTLSALAGNISRMTGVEALVKA
ncbi:hypothetical protein UFOVP699_284 [uncultured Caudovirales phage]|uniref:Uncharacterized protein n=1 Tax=uncultured Caudovirales phage TaxID=2100421 RepID=A0A6J5NR23_9CAUD|nr:hypothetical protein UFOVP699_284 [uncultured Caudovirales phage]